MATLEVKGFTDRDYNLGSVYLGRKLDTKKEIATMFVSSLFYRYFRGFSHSTLSNVTIEGVKVNKFVLEKVANFTSGDDVLYDFKYAQGKSLTVRITLYPTTNEVKIESKEMLPPGSETTEILSHARDITGFINKNVSS